MKTIDQRLNNMRERRIDPTSNFTFDAMAKADSALTRRQNISESYERRAETQWVKYALGAMQEVGAEYTRVSLEEGERVRNQLNSRLDTTFNLQFRYQGSVPLNVHIRGVSDVDLLVLRTDFLTCDSNGPRSYTALFGPRPVEHLLLLRRDCEVELMGAFPTASIDRTGSKAISISKGSLRRKIDVVPAHWHDNTEYQRSGWEAERHVAILLKDQQSTMRNLPFLHIERINECDIITLGSAKKMIRLLKVLKADADDDINLSSYEIAGLVWNFDRAQLTVSIYLELSIVHIAKRFLDYYATNKTEAMKLRTPDNSRCIIDNEVKYNALKLLSLELDALVDSLFREIKPLSISTPDLVETALTSINLPI